ncbi:MAG: hypothetical protein AAGA48_08265 [Myxococcota bacterium]
MTQTKLRVGVVAMVGLLAACTGADDDAPRQSPEVRNLTGTAAALAEVIEKGLRHNNGYMDAYERARNSMLGMGDDGAAFAGDKTSISGNIEADLEQDGTRETALFMTVRGERDTFGSKLTASVSQGSMPGDDLISIFADVRIDIGKMSVEAENISGSYEGEEASVFLSDGQLSYPIMGPSTGDVIGTVQYSAYDDSFAEFLVGEMAAEVADDGFNVRVTIDDDPKTPEDESDSFVVL